jgi:hypothetical protein
VNVNELTITNNSTEWTVYAGESVDPLGELKGLYNNINVLQVIGDGNDTDSDNIDETVKNLNVKYYENIIFKYV